MLSHICRSIGCHFKLCGYVNVPVLFQVAVWESQTEGAGVEPQQAHGAAHRDTELRARGSQSRAQPHSPSARHHLHQPPQVRATSHYVHSTN